MIYVYINLHLVSLSMCPINFLKNYICIFNNLALMSPLLHNLQIEIIFFSSRRYWSKALRNLNMLDVYLDISSKKHD